MSDGCLPQQVLGMTAPTLGVQVLQHASAMTPLHIAISSVILFTHRCTMYLILRAASCIGNHRLDCLETRSSDAVDVAEQDRPLDCQIDLKLAACSSIGILIKPSNKEESEVKQQLTSTNCKLLLSVPPVHA